MKHKDFGAALKAGRLARGLSTRDVDNMTGISYSSISRYETDGIDPSFLYMILMCDLYSIDVNDIADTVRSATHLRDRLAKSMSSRDTNSHTSLGEALRAARERLRLTTRNVEAISGISHVNITRYEADAIMPSFVMTVRLCDCYGLHLNDVAHILRSRHSA